jgi:lysophospholipase L1-like esterase
MLLSEDTHVYSQFPEAFARSAFLPSTHTSPDARTIPYVKPRGNTDLRILCLGASITFGVGSTTGNGYRKELRDMLTAAGATVEYVGTQTSGNMANNANEGYPGFRIDQVMGFAWNSYGYWPNVVLVHLGTNDFVQGYNPQTSADSLGTLIDQVYQAIGSSNPLVVVSKLLPNNRTTTESGIQKFNGLLDGIVSSRVKSGKNVLLVDMHSSDFSLADIGPDGTHPTDAGFHKMAGVWTTAIKSALDANKISSPKNNGLAKSTTNNVHCAVSTSGVSRPSTVQYGFGNKTAIFAGAWTNIGIVMNHTSPNATGVYWAKLNGVSGLGDDYVFIDKDGSMKVAYNKGGETFGALNTVNKPPACDSAGTAFAEMNGDGRDDFCCISSDGTLQVYTTSPGPAWGSAGLTQHGIGDPRAGIFVADVDGDGLGDYVSVSSGGLVSVSYNRGNTWTKFYRVFNIPDFNGGADYAGLRFVDVNGDGLSAVITTYRAHANVSTGRADCVRLTQSYSDDENYNYQVTISAYMNFPGGSMVEPFFMDSGIIMHPIANADLGINQVTFGRVRGTKKYDLATLHDSGAMKVLENRGYKGVAYGPRCRYCDMTGSGSDSYLSIGPSGALKLYQNLHNSGTHIKFGEILPDQGLAANDVHLADLDGDSRCDYIIVNNRTGSLQWRKSNGLLLSGTGGSLSLADPVSLAFSDKPSCDSAGVRFADVDGDGNTLFLSLHSYTY